MHHAGYGTAVSRFNGSGAAVLRVVAEELTRTGQEARRVENGVAHLLSHAPDVEGVESDIQRMDYLIQVLDDLSVVVHRLAEDRVVNGGAPSSGLSEGLSIRALADRLEGFASEIPADGEIDLF